MKTNELLMDSFARIRETVEAALEGLDGDALAERPKGSGNSIAWLIWHLSRVEDAQVSAAAGLDQVWTSQGFVTRFGLPLPERDTGYGHSSEEVGSVQAERACFLSTTTPCTGRLWGSWTDFPMKTWTALWTGTGIRPSRSASGWSAPSQTVFSTWGRPPT